MQVNLKELALESLPQNAAGENRQQELHKCYDIKIKPA